MTDKNDSNPTANHLSAQDRYWEAKTRLAQIEAEMADVELKTMREKPLPVQVPSSVDPALAKWQEDQRKTLAIAERMAAYILAEYMNPENDPKHVMYGLHLGRQMAILGGGLPPRRGRGQS